MKMRSKQVNLRGMGLLMLLLPLLSWGQGRLAYTEFGAGLGTLNQGSDVAVNRSVEGIFKEIRVQGFIHAKRHFNDWFAMGVNLKFGYTESFDGNHGNAQRRLESFATLMQSNLFTEIHLKKFGKYHRGENFTYYLKGGAGFAAWNPTLSTTDNKAFPDKIIPQNDSYNGINTFIGFGFKYRIAYQSIIGLEFTAHFLNEDNFDGFLSDTGGENDGFGGVSIYYSYLLF